MKIELDFNLTDADLKQTNEFAGENSSETECMVYIGTMPIGRLHFVVNSVDFSDYHSHDSRLPLLEFSVWLTQALLKILIGQRFYINHYDNSGGLILKRLTVSEARVTKSNGQSVIVDLQELMANLKLFNCRLRQVLEENCPEYFYKVSSENWLPEGWGE